MQTTMHLAGKDIPVRVELCEEGEDVYVDTVTIEGHMLPQYIHDHLMQQEIERKRREALDEASDVLAIINGGR